MRPVFALCLYGSSFLILFLFVIIRILFRNLLGDFEDFGIFYLRVERGYLFYGDVVFPLIAVIEEIIRSRSGGKMMPDIAFAGENFIVVNILFIPHGDAAVFALETIEVVILPVEQRIQEIVKFLEVSAYTFNSKG